MSKILIIDDDPHICKLLTTIFQRMEHGVDHSLTLNKGLEQLFAQGADIVFLDVNLPDGNGLEAIGYIKNLPLAPEIIIMTGDSDPEGAELAMNSKAWDYIQKSGSPKEFKFSLIRALEYRRQKQSNTHERKIDRDAIIGTSRQVKDCLDKVIKAANCDVSVVITGETGTGKELFAKAIHQNSCQRKNHFIVVDCAALPEHLVESTLFGHVRGAFTGAESDKTGLMQMADKGTLFLDEVGELPLDVQKKFLRAIQEKRFRPLGGKKEIFSDFRLICATHRDLSHMVKENSFREDLFFRIFSLNIHLPPLKDRTADIIALAKHRLSRRTALSGEAPHCVSPEFFKELQLYDWPGNVRELINTIDVVCSEAIQGTTLFPHHLPGHIRAFNIRKKINTHKEHTPSAKTFFPGESKESSLPTLKNHMEQSKKRYLKELLASTGGDIKNSCELSGLSRGHLYRLMQQFDLTKTT
ncbi:MAG: sigma-54 dependent transcriptional regulator [Desulfobacterium sp.]|jgi:two-component system NtrC family response regulator|nr:sigma-54 dependent transcriptional regulator [Desulfobacterium sp.]